MDRVDVLVIGAGVIGLAITRELSTIFSDVLLVEKNSHYGEETSSRNSEVIHAGIYYPTQSLKAKLCVSGKIKLYEYCQSRHIPHHKLGKLIVGHSLDDENTLAKIQCLAADNGVNDLTWVSKKKLHQHPYLSAQTALSCPSTGIIDVHAYMQSLLADAEQHNAMFVAQTQMTKAEPTNQGFTVTLNSQGECIQISCRYLINCAGLHSVTTAHTIEQLSPTLLPKLYFCRGHYFAYQGKSPFTQLIYPVPEKNGLGIHASLDMGGQLKFGPDTFYLDTLSYDVPLSFKEKFYRSISQYFPLLDIDKLQPAYSGIRAKLQGPNDDFKDFVFQDARHHNLPGLINLFGIDSPGLTSSLAIAEHVKNLIIR